MVAFVVLHYKNINDTIECLKLIKALGDQEKIKIIVVDNHTLKISEIKKIEEYTKDIVLLNKNLGFAKANNIGCKYVLENYNPDFYCVINNDVFIYQKNFVEEIFKMYDMHCFDMLGPKIDSPTGESVNPFPVFKTKEEVVNEISKCQKLIKIYDSFLLTLLLTIYVKLKRVFVKPKVAMNGYKIETNVALHGCAIIFSKKYVQKYRNVFYEKTFLFHEEEFLYQRLLRDKQVSIYDPNLKIFHKEGSSVKTKMKSNRKSKLFRESERLKSLKLLLREM